MSQPRTTGQTVEDEGEVAARYKLADAWKIEHRAIQRHEVLAAINDLHFEGLR